MPNITQQHYQKHVLVALNNSHPFFQLKGELTDVVYHIKCHRKIFCSEKDPAKSYEMESENNGNKGSDSFPNHITSFFFRREIFREDFIYSQSHTVQSSPNDES